MSRDLYLGVDGGGTKTACWVADTEGVRGTGRAGPSSWGSQNAGPHIREAVGAALEAAGASLQDVRRAVFGLSGADFPEDYDLFNSILEPIMGDVPFRVVNDTEVALVGGSATGWGVVSICGSGTNCLGRHPDGRAFTIGGMGYDGDHGGGGDLIRTAVARGFQADQGRGRPTVMRERILEILGQPDYNALSRGIHLGQVWPTVGPEARRELVEMVFLAAQGGDGVAQDMLVDMGTALGHTVGAAALRLQSTDPRVADAASIEVVMAGSVWRGPHPLLIDAFRLNIHRYVMAVDIHLAIREPVAGAVLIAVEDDGGPRDDVRDRLPLWSEEEHR
jgi:N-acetylglucosamine kinase-like BadF-type ATPase